MTDKLSIVEEAKKRFKRAEEVNAELRALAVEDTKFALADSDNQWQWPDGVRKGREDDERVILTVNMTAQHCNQINNEIRRNRPTVKVSPVDSYADKDTASILGGLIRNIQVSSSADTAHDLASEHSVYGGEGYWRIVTEYETPTSFDQCIVIKSCPRPGLVYTDPDHDDPNKEWGFIFEDITLEQFEREYPDLDQKGWEKEADGWCSKDTVRRAEYFYCTTVPDVSYLLASGETVLKSALKGVTFKKGVDYVKERKTYTKSWKWCKLLGGHDEPIDETDWLGEYLPIVSVIGKEIYVGDELVRKGQVRDLKDPQRMVNYAYSETAQTLALQNKIPYLAAAEAVEGYEDQWANANSSNDAFLKWNAYDSEGNQLPKPERQLPAVMPQAQVQFLQLSTEQMRAASGQQNSNFGIKSEASSGIGIERLKVQGETATFHFPDNLARALTYEAKILINLIQKYYDTKRIIRILGLDGKEEHVTLDPEMQGAYAEDDTEEEVKKIFNPTVGRYDVTVDIGPNYQTQRQEGAAALNELAARNPALMQVAGDLIMRSQDFPMAEELAERLEKTLPPGLKEEKGQAEIPPQVQQQMQMMGQQIQQMGQALQEAQGQLQEAQSGVQAKREQAAMDAQSRLEAANLDAQIRMETANIDAQTVIRKAEIDAEAKLMAAKMTIASDEELAELNGYIELQKAQMAAPSPAMTQDVEEGFDATPLPSIIARRIPKQPKAVPTRKTIQLMAPSGQVYTGMIQDEPIEVMDEPMGEDM